ncbi:MAG: copper amine oxidase N-terminal domain-containing protein, partial [Candidatus Gracilibacteria bacterium]|nr:copper amine oxidase N-terminal domain-containing protein [Candidatus Gracilibacteria bacterium]
KSTLANYLQSGSYYKVRVNLYDDKSSERIGYSGSFKYEVASVVANQAPTVSNVSTNFDGNGNLNVTFSASDPEGKTMGADLYIVDSSGNTASWSSSTKTSANASDFYNVTQTASFSKSTLANYLQSGSYYKVRVNLYDDKSSERIGYSGSFKYEVASVKPEIKVVSQPEIKAVKQPEIKVILDGKTLTFEQPPIIKDSRILVPLRKIFEELGSEVNWIGGSEQKIVAKKGDIEIILFIGNNIAYVNGEEIKLDVPPQIINGRTLVPIRFVGEAFGADVKWDGDNRIL